jgi:hypothetical protein
MSRRRMSLSRAWRYISLSVILCLSVSRIDVPPSLDVLTGGCRHLISSLFDPQGILICFSASVLVRHSCNAYWLSEHIVL